MRRAAGATPTQTDARSISTILADANGRAWTFSDAKMRHRRWRCPYLVDIEDNCAAWHCPPAPKYISCNL
jgi:hypothetical protein